MSPETRNTIKNVIGTALLLAVAWLGYNIYQLKKTVSKFEKKFDQYEQKFNTAADTLAADYTDLKKGIRDKSRKLDSLTANYNRDSARKDIKEVKDALKDGKQSLLKKIHERTGKQLAKDSAQ